MCSKCSKCSKHAKFAMFETNLRPIMIGEFAGTFCKFNKENFTALDAVFPKETFRVQKGNIDYLYITEDLKVNCTYLKKKTLKKLGLKQIRLLDGFWYFKEDLK